jgi:hypothetical protein
MLSEAWLILTWRGRFAATALLGIRHPTIALVNRGKRQNFVRQPGASSAKSL